MGFRSPQVDRVEAKLHKIIIQKEYVHVDEAYAYKAIEYYLEKYRFLKELEHWCIGEDRMHLLTIVEKRDIYHDPQHYGRMNFNESCYRIIRIYVFVQWPLKAGEWDDGVKNTILEYFNRNHGLDKIHITRFTLSDREDRAKFEYEKEKLLREGNFPFIKGENEVDIIL